MSFVTGLGVYFILWWLVLFTVLPFGIQTQEESGDVVPGLTPSAPVRPLLLRKIIATTLIAGLIFALLWGLMQAGYGIDDIPFLPEF